MIPAYNTDRYIYDCLISVKRQTYRDIQCIIVDDGSTDRTMEVIENFCNENRNRFYSIEVERHKINQGPCAAINSALKLVRGEYTMWFDSDDLLAEDNIEKKVRYLTNHSDTKCVMAEADCFDESGILNYKLGDSPCRAGGEKLFEKKRNRY